MFRTASRLIIASVVLPVTGLVLLEFFFRSLPLWWQPVYQKLFDSPQRMYIYVLGESTAEGVQYQEKISPAVLVTYQFNDSLQGKPVEIIELAKSGTTIEYNYFQFYFETLFRPRQNALVIIYSGINEGTGNVYDRGFESWKQWQKSVVLSKLYYMFGSYSNSPQKYRFRYREIIELAKEHKYKTVLSQLVGNVADYDPEVFENDDLLRPGYLEAFIRAESIYRNGGSADADSCYRNLYSKLQQPHPFLIYRIAHCKRRELQFDSARLYFSQLPEMCGYVGYAAWKNKILEEVSRQPDVALAHTFDRFVDSSENGLVGYNLINDAHHPNILGYCIMSRELAKEVSKLYRENIKRNISEEIIKKHFGFDKEFEAGVYFKLIEWFIYETFETQMRMQRLSRLEYYMLKYGELKRSTESVLVWKLLVSILEKNGHSFAEAVRNIDVADKRQMVLERIRGGFAGSPYKEQIKAAVRQFNLKNRELESFVREMETQLN